MCIKQDPWFTRSKGTASLLRRSPCACLHAAGGRGWASQLHKEQAWQGRQQQHVWPRSGKRARDCEGPAGQPAASPELQSAPKRQRSAHPRQHAGGMGAGDAAAASGLGGYSSAGPAGFRAGEAGQHEPSCSARGRMGQGKQDRGSKRGVNGSNQRLRLTGARVEGQPQGEAVLWESQVGWGIAFT